MSAAGFAALWALIGGVALPSRGDAQTYYNYDGSTTSDLNAALATWTSAGEFAYSASPIRGDWGLAAMKAHYAYVLGFSGAGVKLGAVDSGLLLTHQEFATRGNVNALTITGTYRDDGYQKDKADRAWKAGDAFTTSGAWTGAGNIPAGIGANDNHGSHVSGSIAAAKNGVGMMGVAWGSQFYITNSNGSDSSIYGSNMDYNYFYQAYGALAKAGVRAINSSWGTPPRTDDFNTVAGVIASYTRLQSLDSTGVQTKKSWLDAAVDVTRETGVLQVFAAGNTADANVNTRSALPYFRPEMEPYWVSVAALNTNLTRASFSNACGLAKYWCVSAPGVSINSLQATDTGYLSQQGTSMAAPHVTGALGLLMQRYPGLDNVAIRTILLTTSQHLGTGSADIPNTTFGWGIPDLQKAMNGPGQLLGTFNANIASGTDTWSNSISEAALKQREIEEKAEIAAWPAAMRALLSKLVVPPPHVNADPSIVAGVPKAINLLKAALDLRAASPFKKSDFDAAVNAANADPVGKLLIAAYAAVNPTWKDKVPFATDLQSFIAGRTDAQLADDLANVTRLNAIAANGLILNQINLTQARISALSSKSKSDYVGSLIKTGNGALILSGNNTYTGATGVLQGTLQGGAINAFAQRSAHVVAAGATLDLGGFSQTIGSLNGAGSVTNSGPGSATLTAGSDGSNSVFSGTMSNGAGTFAFNKTGAGTLILSGNNTYTGETTVEAGGLIVTGSIASSPLTTVRPGALLGGNGTVGGVFVDGGALAPGASLGTLTVQGNLAMTASARYYLNVTPDAASTTAVSGTAQLGNATLFAAWSSGSYVMKRYTVLSAAGGVAGTFDGPVNSNLPVNFISSLSYDRNNAYLNLTMQQTGLNANQQAVSNALVNSFNTAGGIPMRLGALSSQGISVASGEAATAVQQPGMSVMSSFTGLMAGAAGAGGGTSAPAGAAAGQTATGTATASARPAEGYSALGMAPAPTHVPQTSRWALWGSGFASEINTGGDSRTGAASSRAQIYGSAAGATYAVTRDTSMGLAVGGAGTSVSLPDGLGRGRAEVVQTGIYGRYGAEGVYVSGALSYGWQDTRTERSVLGDQLKAHFNANAVSARLESGVRVASGWVDITPYAALSGTALYLPSYAEKGGTPGASALFALNYSGAVIRSPRREFGVRVEQSHALDETATLFLRGRAAWAHSFETQRGVEAAFVALPASSFVVSGASPSSDSALLSASAEIKWSSGMGIAASLESDVSRSSQGYSAKADFKWEW